MKKVALFFGSFNPIHNGHLILANYISEFAGVDELRFVVSPQNPFKQDRRLMPDDLRLEMVKRAIAGYSKFSVSDIEFTMSKPSYTYETLRNFSEQEPDAKFYLIMGGDNLSSFDKWRNAEWIASNYGILVYPRPGEENVVPEKWKNAVTIVEGAPLMDISSTMVREAKKEGRDLRFFVPSGIWSMMDESLLSNVD